MKAIEEIKENITSKDKDLLNQSLNLINEHLKREAKRGDSAFQRVSMLLTLTGILSGIFIFFGKLVLIDLNGNLMILIYFIYALIIIFFFKTIYFSIKTIDLQHALELSPNTVYEIQSMKNNEALRYEIAEKMWEYDQMLPYNNKKLFNYSRGQRNLLFGMFFILILGLLFIINGKIQLDLNFQYAISIILIIFAIFCDKILEHFGFWEFN